MTIKQGQRKKTDWRTKGFELENPQAGGWATHTTPEFRAQEARLVEARGNAGVGSDDEALENALRSLSNRNPQGPSPTESEQVYDFKGAISGAGETPVKTIATESQVGNFQTSEPTGFSVGTNPFFTTTNRETAFSDLQQAGAAQAQSTGTGTNGTSNMQPASANPARSEEGVEVANMNGSTGNVDNPADQYFQFFRAKKLGKPNWQTGN